MRFRSKKVGGYRVYAVSGTTTVSFAIDADPGVTGGLLGFAVERHDPVADERYYMYGYKVFPSVYPDPTEDLLVTTYDQPVQSFVWDDFTAKPGQAYEYVFHPLKGKPKNIDRSAKPITIAVETEPLFTEGTHDVFFNRGVASSQAYHRKFGNVPPDKLVPPSLKQEAFDWLSRDLDEALLKFIDQAKKGDGLLCCFYEFRYKPVADRLKAAIDRGVDVQLIIDAKENGAKGKAPFPRDDNLAMVKAAKLPASRVKLREANPTNIAHNKFMVWMKGKTRKPTEVWTGSTNISEGGIFGQANVGHWLRDPVAADRFRAYWELLHGDPGSLKADDRTTVRKKKDALRADVGAINPTPATRDEIAAGVTTVFSPRSGSTMLELYADLVDHAAKLSCITLAFGISHWFKDKLKDNKRFDHLAFFLLEKRDVKNPKSTQPFISLDSRNNVYKAWGSFLHEPLYQWTAEKSTSTKGGLGLNTHVMFIHSKFLLADPLGPDPITVTGSANFSDPSTNDNDENMLVIRGDRRVADIYFTEFNRLFGHYYFRSVREATSQLDLPAPEAHKVDLQTLFLAEDDTWLANYKPNSLKTKRVRAITEMAL